MKRLSLVFAALLVISLAGASCRKKEKPPVPPPTQGEVPAVPGTPAGPMGGGPEKKVVVPEDVQAAWKAVKIEVEFKKNKTSKQFTVPLNSDFKVPDTDLTLTAGAFLPHFSMTADQITSLSNNPENPACNISVTEGGKELFKGWLFARFPDVHPFQHDAFALKLIEGVRK